MSGDKVEELTKVFRALDTDHSGTLNYEEVTKLASRFFDGRQPQLTLTLTPYP